MAGNDVHIIVGVTDQTGPGLHSAQQNAQSASQHISNSLANIAGGGANALRDSVGRAGGVMEKLGPAAGAVGAAIGVAMAGAAVAVKGLQKALEASIERADVGALAGAQTGLTSPAEVAKLGRIAGQVYADNFGESIQQAGQAVRDAIRNKLIPEDAGDGAIKAISEKLLTLGQVVEGDTAEVARSLCKLLVTDIVGSADEAFDLITRAAQTGVGEAGDLLETISEYSIQFKELGISGKEAFGLVSQGLAGGARDADTVADALKEIAIRAKDGSKASADGFKMLGLDAAKLGPMFAQGGAQARTALDMVIDKTKGIKDPMEKNAIATALFGTKSEDLQDALFGLDLDTAAAGLGDIAGAADKASDALGRGLGPTIEGIKRKFGQFAADIGDKITPLISGMIDVYQGFATDLAGVFEGSAVPGEVMESIRKVAKDYLPALREAFGSIVEKVRENRATFEKLGRFLAEYVIPIVGFALVEGVKKAGVAIGGLVEGFALLVEATYTVRNAVIDMTLTAVNNFDTIATGAAKAFGKIPGPVGDSFRQAAKEVHEFVQQVNNDLKNIRDEDVYIRTHFVGGQGQSRGGDYRTGGITGAMSYAATGGVRGGLVKVGEDGAEFIRTPTGSMVYPKANTRQLEAMGAQMAGQGGTAVEVRFSGDQDGPMAQWFMNAQRSGQVQILTTAIA